MISNVDQQGTSLSSSQSISTPNVSLSSVGGDSIISQQKSPTTLPLVFASEPASLTNQSSVNQLTEQLDSMKFSTDLSKTSSSNIQQTVDSKPSVSSGLQATISQAFAVNSPSSVPSSFTGNNFPSFQPLVQMPPPVSFSAPSSIQSFAYSSAPPKILPSQPNFPAQPSGPTFYGGRMSSGLTTASNTSAVPSLTTLAGTQPQAFRMQTSPLVSNMQQPSSVPSIPMSTSALKPTLPGATNVPPSMEPALQPNVSTFKPSLNYTNPLSSHPVSYSGITTHNFQPSLHPNRYGATTFKPNVSIFNPVLAYNTNPLASVNTSTPPLAFTPSVPNSIQSLPCESSITSTANLEATSASQPLTTYPSL